MIRANILLIADDPAILQALSDALHGGGHQTLYAPSARARLLLSVAPRPDLAFIDIDASHAWHSMQPSAGFAEVPFICVSTAGDAASVRRAAALGAAGYLLKPVQPAQVRAAVTVSLARAQEMKRLSKSEHRLQEALRRVRQISTVVGILMERLRLDNRAAFEHLRDLARKQRKRTTELAAELLAAGNSFTTPRAEPDSGHDATPLHPTC